MLLIPFASIVPHKSAIEESIQNSGPPFLYLLVFAQRLLAILLHNPHGFASNPLLLANLHSSSLCLTLNFSHRSAC